MSILVSKTFTYNRELYLKIRSRKVDSSIRLLTELSQILQQIECRNVKRLLLNIVSFFKFNFTVKHQFYGEHQNDTEGSSFFPRQALYTN